MSTRDARRPIAKTREKSGRESYTAEKLAWLVQVAQDPKAEYGLPLAVGLAITHVNRDTGKCNPGDEALAENLRRSTKTIQRMRKVLIGRGHLLYEFSKTGQRRDGKSTHTLLIEAPPTGGQHAVHQSDPTGGQISADWWTDSARLVDSEKRQVIDPANKSFPNQEEPVLNQGREHHHAKNPNRKAARTLADVVNDKAAAVARKYGRVQ